MNKHAILHAIDEGRLHVLVDAKQLDVIASKSGSSEIRDFVMKRMQDALILNALIYLILQDAVRIELTPARRQLLTNMGLQDALPFFDRPAGVDDQEIKTPMPALADIPRGAFLEALAFAGGALYQRYQAELYDEDDQADQLGGHGDSRESARIYMALSLVRQLAQLLTRDDVEFRSPVGAWKPAQDHGPWAAHFEPTLTGPLIVYGPAGCGKSSNQLLLAQTLFGEDDAWDDWTPEKTPIGGLHLTNRPPPYRTRVPWIHFDTAMAAVAMLADREGT